MNRYYKKKILLYYFIGLTIPVLLFFFKLQVIDYQKYKKLSGDNSIRSVEIKAPRGIIYDRNHTPLVDNLPTYALKIIPIDVIDRKTNNLLEDFDINLLESIIGVDKESFISKVQKKNKKLEKFSPVTIKRFIEFEISSDIHSQIIKLKNKCFPDFQKTRSYYKQLPHFRYIVFEGKTLSFTINFPSPIKALAI